MPATRILASGAMLAALASPALADEINMTPAITKTLTAAIRANDFECPVAKMAWTKEPTARGSIFKVRCGPDDGTGDVFVFAYRVTLTPSERLIVEEWE
ncbi:hypothetical protein [Ensifer sp. LCM 4579]|uniref:hypothetical protein n=1 Tax=Ensifer sp. LCM 4579 TaxID=1848292 RepID=UPI0008D9D399|nr:hypothetical protein [Ensifer sp. LCM 4579]OHV85824.1 hypothetical protein LCM4579_00185 [Ensifer sp. LCM 4579]